MTPSLASLAVQHGTDKGPLPGWHNYTNAYDLLLARRRDQVRSVAELGIGAGSSLRMWRDYFASATIHGLDWLRDVAPEILEVLRAEARICVHEGNQADRDALAELVACGAPFDLIIDDASHQASDVVISLETLWNALAPTGLYVIEDVWKVRHAMLDQVLSAAKKLPVDWLMVPSADPERCAVVLFRKDVEW